MPRSMDVAPCGHKPMQRRALWLSVSTPGVVEPQGATVARRQNAALVVAEYSLYAFCGFIAGEGVDAGAAGQNNGSRSGLGPRCFDWIGLPMLFRTQWLPKSTHVVAGAIGVRHSHGSKEDPQCLAT